MSPTADAASAAPYVLDQIDLDCRAEVVAANLIEQGVPLDRLLINPTGLGQRAYSKDSTEPAPWVPAGTARAFYRLDSPRESLFDMLPHNLFFTPKRKRSDLTDVETVVEQIRLERREEAQARQFFQPFDAELQYLRVLRAQRETAADRLEDAPRLIEQFARQWPILREIDPLYAGLFVQMLPLLHQLRNDLGYLSRLLTLLLGVPARIDTGRLRPGAIRASGQRAIGDCRLGLDAVVGDTFDDGRNSLRITLGPVPDALIDQFLPHAPTMRLLDQLYDHFLPASVDVTTVITTERPVPDAPVTGPFLGFNSYL